MKLEDLKKISEQFRQPITAKDQHAVQNYLHTIGLDPENLYQELEMSNPYVQAHSDVSYSNATVSLHSHTFYEVLYCRNTCGAEYLVGSERYRLEKGDIVFVPPGVSHRPLLPESMAQPYVRDILWFSAEFVNMVEGLFPHTGRPVKEYSSLLRTANTPWEFLGQQLRDAVTESEHRHPGWETAVMGMAIVFLSRLKRALTDEHAIPMTAEKPELLDKAMAYIEANLSSKITLEDIARHLYVSKSTVTQTFRSRMGVSFHRCLSQRRLIAAKILIQKGLHLEEIALQTGFRDYSGFYRAFRQEYGISPRHYRNLCAAGKASDSGESANT